MNFIFSKKKNSVSISFESKDDRQKARSLIQESHKKKVAKDCHRIKASQNKCLS